MARYNSFTRGKSKLKTPALDRFLIWLRSFHVQVEAVETPHREVEGAVIVEFVFTGVHGNDLHLFWAGKPAGMYPEQYPALYSTLQSYVIEDHLSEFAGKAGDKMLNYVASLMGVDGEIPGQPNVVPALQDDTMARGFAHRPTVKADGTGKFVAEAPRVIH